MKQGRKRYAALVRRLDDWGAYRRDTAPVLGWNVHLLDFDPVRGIQKRNDTHSDPVGAEAARMAAEQKRNMTTDTAVAELRPVLLRRLIFARHLAYTDLSDSQIGARLGIDHRVVKFSLALAYEALIEALAALEHQRYSAA
jgi:hypothetical protein